MAGQTRVNAETIASSTGSAVFGCRTLINSLLPRSLAVVEYMLGQ